MLASLVLVPTVHSQREGALGQPVTVQGGLVSGVPGTHAGITAFRGVPFAAPPVGDRRWQAPQPATAWTGVRNAATFGPSCIQRIVQDSKPWTYEFMTHGEISEDCLFVNIWTPAKSASEKRPVLIYIYGEAADEFLNLYPASTDDIAKVAQNQSARDVARTTLYLWAINRGTTAKTKAYTYFWNHVLPGPDAARYGAFHTSEVPYVLNTLEKSDRPFTDADRRIADTISSYWVNFATSGDPNGKGLPAWPVADGKTWMTMELSEHPHAIPVADSPAKQAFLERALSRR